MFNIKLEKRPFNWEKYIGATFIMGYTEYTVISYSDKYDRFFLEGGYHIKDIHIMELEKEGKVIFKI